MGIDSNRFVDQNAIREYECPICLEVIEDPIQCPSEHAFCSQCIRVTLQNAPRCPVDNLCLNSVQLTVPSRHFRNGHNNLQLKCKFVAHGCTNVQYLENITGHESNCFFRNGKPKNERQQHSINDLRNRLTALELLVSKQGPAPSSMNSPQSLRIDNLEREVTDLKRSKSYLMRWVILFLVIFGCMIGLVIYDTYEVIVPMNRDYNFTAIRELATLLEERVNILQGLIESLEINYEKAKTMITELIGDYWKFKEEILDLESNITEFMGKTKYDISVLQKDDNVTTDQIKQIWTVINEMKNGSEISGINQFMLISCLFTIFVFNWFAINFEI